MKPDGFSLLDDLNGMKIAFNSVYGLRKLLFFGTTTPRQS